MCMCVSLWLDMFILILLWETVMAGLHSSCDPCCGFLDCKFLVPFWLWKWMLAIASEATLYGWNMMCVLCECYVGRGVPTLLVLIEALCNVWLCLSCYGCCTCWHKSAVFVALMYTDYTVFKSRCLAFAYWPSFSLSLSLSLSLRTQGRMGWNNRASDSWEDVC